MVMVINNREAQCPFSLTSCWIHAADDTIAPHNQSLLTNTPGQTRKLAMSIKRQLVTTLALIIPDFWISQLRNPLFIIGTARSGTSLLARLVGRHPEIANWSEANEVWDPTGYPAPPHKAPDWVDPYRFNDRWWADTQSRLKEIPAVFGVFQTLRRKPYFLNKSPFNTFRIPHILQLFPAARFISIQRHGLAVVSSRLNKESGFIQGMPYHFPPDETRYDFETAALCFARLWQFSVQEVQEQDTRLNLSRQGKLLPLTYEQLCHDSAATLAQVQQFIGLQTPFILDEPITNQNDKWRQTFDLNMAQRLVQAMQPTFSELGYSL
jgi:Sulfotransferase family